MAGYAIDRLLLLTASLTPAVATSSSIGDPIIVSSSSLNGDRFRTYTTAAGIATDLSAGYLTSLAAAQATAALAQDNRPTSVRVARFTVGSGETAWTGLQAAFAEGLTYGPVGISDRTDATIAALATGLQSDATIKWLCPFVFQDSQSDWLSGIKPASLVACENPQTRALAYNDGAVALDGALLGRYSGYNFQTALLNGRGGCASKQRVSGIAASTFTAAQDTAMLGIGVGVLEAFAPGTLSSTFVLLGEEAYDGATDWSAVLAITYLLRRAREELSALWLDYINDGQVIYADRRGIALVSGVVSAVAQELAGLWSPTEALPNGWSVEGSVASGIITITLTVSVAGEVTQIALDVEGEVV